MTSLLTLVLRYPPSIDGSKPRRTTRQRIYLDLALHHQVPQGEMRSSALKAADQPMGLTELDTGRSGSQALNSSFPGEALGQSSASTSRVETASRHSLSQGPLLPLIEHCSATTLVVRCRFAPRRTASVSLVVAHRPQPLASSSYDSGYASNTPSPRSRSLSTRGQLRSAMPDAPTPVTEEGDGESSHSSSEIRRDKPTNRQANPTQHLSWVSGDEPTPSTSPSTRRSSRRPSTAPSLDRDPLWLPPAFGTASPRAAA